MFYAWLSQHVMILVCFAIIDIVFTILLDYVFRHGYSVLGVPIDFFGFSCLLNFEFILIIYRIRVIYSFPILGFPHLILHSHNNDKMRWYIYIHNC